jgi:hypothetical protein
MHACGKAAHARGVTFLVGAARYTSCSWTTFGRCQSRDVLLYRVFAYFTMQICQLPVACSVPMLVAALAPYPSSACCVREMPVLQLCKPQTRPPKANDL